MTNPAFADLRRKQRAKAVPPVLHRFVGDVDAPFVEQVFNLPKGKREPTYRPNFAPPLTNGPAGHSPFSARRSGISVRPKAPQMRQIGVCDSPAAFAIERSDQWVASAGREVSVRSITCATFPSSMVRGRPGRGSSDRPSMRSLTKRLRHLPTVCSCTPISAATALLPSPSAQRRIMRQRSLPRWHTDWKRAFRPIRLHATRYRLSITAAISTCELIASTDGSLPRPLDCS